MPNLTADADVRCTPDCGISKIGVRISLELVRCSRWNGRRERDRLSVIPRAKPTLAVAPPMSQNRPKRSLVSEHRIAGSKPGETYNQFQLRNFNGYSAYRAVISPRSLLSILLFIGECDRGHTAAGNSIVYLLPDG